MVLLSVKSIKGRREYMEDRYAYFKKDNILICILCDGHGGYLASDITCKELPQLLFNALEKVNTTNIKNAHIIRKVINNWEIRLKEYNSGTTLTGIIVKDDITFVINIGDSRTCLNLHNNSIVYNLEPKFGNNGIFIDNLIVNYIETNFLCTKDHDPNSLIEKERISKAGGKITFGRLNGILSLTRALGDYNVGPGICAIPDIYWVKNECVNGPIVMYSDGIYEPQRNKSSVNFSDKYLYLLATKINAEALVDYAYDNNSEDNLTAIVVDFY